MKRVVITATGVISPVGLSTEAFWESLTAGRHGFAPIASFDPARVPVKCAAEVKGFDPVAMGINKKDARRMDRYTQFAMAAAAELMEKAGDLGEVDPYRVGILVSSGIGGLMTTLNEHVKYMEKGPERLSVFTIPMMISNMAAGQLAITYGLRGTTSRWSPPAPPGPTRWGRGSGRSRTATWTCASWGAARRPSASTPWAALPTWGR